MMNKGPGSAADIISLQKGEGALHCIGEKFSPDRHIWMGKFTVPIALGRTAGARTNLEYQDSSAIP
jgi:hypothetical protein